MEMRRRGEKRSHLYGLPTYSIFFHQVINVDGRYTDCSRYHLKPVDGMRDEAYTDGSFDSKNGIK